MELKIEDVALVLGQTVDRVRLTDPPFHKVGLLRRLATGRGQSRELFTAANVQLQILAGDFAVYPCTDRYLDHDRRWETRAALYLEQGGLCEVKFEVIDGRYAAPNFFDRFCRLYAAALGDPLRQSDRRMVWRHDGSIVTARLGPRAHQARFRFKRDEDR